MSVLPAADKRFDITVPVAVIGAGACGLIAALAAHDIGADVVVFERDAVPRGSTALSSGFIPAAGTRYQRARGVKDSPALLLKDIQHKSHGQSDAVLADLVANESGPTIEWLADKHGIEFVLVDGFLYPGHSVLRMHAHPRRTGEALMGALLDAVNRAGIDIVTEAHVVDLYSDPDGRVRGFSCLRPDGTREEIGCDALVFACNGYGGNIEMLRRHIPEMAEALYFGHVGNQGDAVRWGEALGGVALDMGAYQGHGSVAAPHNILITWALMMEGGFQITPRARAFPTNISATPSKRSRYWRSRAASPGASMTNASTRWAAISRITATPRRQVRSGRPMISRRWRRSSMFPWPFFRKPSLRWRAIAAAMPTRSAAILSGSPRSRRLIMRSASPGRCFILRADSPSTRRGAFLAQMARHCRICLPAAAPPAVFPGRLCGATYPETAY